MQGAADPANVGGLDSNDVPKRAIGKLSGKASQMQTLHQHQKHDEATIGVNGHDTLRHED